MQIIFDHPLEKFIEFDAIALAPYRDPFAADECRCHHHKITTQSHHIRECGSVQKVGENLIVIVMHRVIKCKNCKNQLLLMSEPSENTVFMRSTKTMEQDQFRKKSNMAALRVRWARNHGELTNEAIDIILRQDQEE